jgi:hypothetical protein
MPIEVVECEGGRPRRGGERKDVSGEVIGQRRLAPVWLPAKYSEFIEGFCMAFVHGYKVCGR